jgi:hypothetical protein
MAEGCSRFTAFWYQGVDVLLKGDAALAQEIWMAAMLDCQVDEVEEQTNVLVKILEATAIALLQSCNPSSAYQVICEKRCG